MGQFVIRAAFIAACMLGVSSAHAQSGHGNHGAHGTAQAETMSAASQAYMDAMNRMNEDMAVMEMSGKAGVDFALMMIPHHQSAIDMAQAYLDSDENDPALIELSQEIIAAQEDEIAFLRDWLARNGH